MLFCAVIPTSNDLTGEKWDYPFGSPLLNAFVIEGLHSTGQSGAQQVALELAQRLVKTCYEGYTAHKTLFKEVRVTITHLYTAADFNNIGPICTEKCYRNQFNVKRIKKCCN